MLDIDGLNISISRGDTEELTFEFEDDVPPDNTVVSIALKRYPNDKRCIWEKSAVVTDGKFTIRFDHSDTDVSPDTYKWDICLEYEDGEVYHPMDPADFKILGVVSNARE